MYDVGVVGDRFIGGNLRAEKCSFLTRESNVGTKDGFAKGEGNAYTSSTHTEINEDGEFQFTSGRTVGFANA